MYILVFLSLLLFMLKNYSCLGTASKSFLRHFLFCLHCACLNLFSPSTACACRENLCIFYIFKKTNICENFMEMLLYELWLFLVVKRWIAHSGTCSWVLGLCSPDPSTASCCPCTQSATIMCSSYSLNV